VDDFISLVRDQDAGRDHGQVLRPAAPHRQSDALGALEDGIGDDADGKRRGVGEGADVGEQPEQDLLDHIVVGVEVQLVLRVVRPMRQEAAPARENQADRERDEDE